MLVRNIAESIKIPLAYAKFSQRGRFISYVTKINNDILPPQHDRYNDNLLIIKNNHIWLY